MAEQLQGEDSAAWAPRPAGVGGRRRRRMVRRSEQLTVKFSLEEREVVGVAAARCEGMAPSAWVGATAVAVAKGEVRPLPSGMGDALAELVETRTQLRRFSTLVNQAVAALHSTGQLPPELLAAVELTSRAVRRVDQATAALAGLGA